MGDIKDLPNPFGNTVVANPWERNQADVPEIHGEAFRRCSKHLDDVRREGKTRSIVIFGESGCGKTHLLRRLRASWLGEPKRGVDPIEPEVVFVAVKLQTSPNRLWRYLRQSLVDDLLRDSAGGDSQLVRILLRRLAEVRGADADLRGWFDWLRASHATPGEFETTIEGLFDAVNAESQLGRDLCVVLQHVLLGRHRRDAVAWLRGDPLPDERLVALGLAYPDDDAEPEDEAREVVTALCRLAGSKIPVVFCFDQLEALQVDRKDTTALGTFGRMVMELFEKTTNLLIIASVQIVFIDALKGSMLQPAWARLAMDRHAIGPLRWEEAIRLVAARLDGVPELRAARRSHPGEPLWPLDAEKLRKKIGDRGDTARQILRWSAGLFEAWQEGRNTVEAPRPADLGALWRDREASARPNVENRLPEILEHGLTLLLHAVHPDWRLVDDRGRRFRDLDLLWQGPDGRIGIHFLFDLDMRSVWRRLDRLTQVVRGRQVEKLLVVHRGQLRGQKVTANFGELLKAGARELLPAPEVIAALDALRTLLSDAKSGDLTADGKAVDLPTLETWLKENLPASLKALADEIVAYPGIEPPKAPDMLGPRIAELLEVTPIRPLPEVADALGISSEAVEACVRNRGEEFGWIEGPPHVLYRRVPVEDRRGSPAPA